MRHLYIDIETLPCADPAEVPTPKAPSNYKDPEKIAAYIEEARASAWRETSLDPLLGRVFCIGTAVDDNPVETLYDADGTQEERLIGELAATVAYATENGRYSLLWIGHNISGFDLRWLWFRAVKYGHRELARLLPYQRWQQGQIADTLRIAQGSDWSGKGLGLSRLAEFFGMAGKAEGLDGSKVYDAWLAGEHDRIRAYCAADVELARSLYDRFEGNMGGKL